MVRLSKRANWGPAKAAKMRRGSFEHGTRCRSHKVTGGGFGPMENFCFGLVSTCGCLRQRGLERLLLSEMAIDRLRRPGAMFLDVVQRDSGLETERRSPSPETVGGVVLVKPAA